MALFEVHTLYRIRALCTKPLAGNILTVGVLLTAQEMRSVEFMGRNLFVQLSKDTPDRKREDGRAKRQKRDHFESQVGEAG